MADSTFRNRTCIGDWPGQVPQDQTWFFSAPAIAVKQAGVRDDTLFMASDPSGNKYLGMNTLLEGQSPVVAPPASETGDWEYNMNAENATLGETYGGSASDQFSNAMATTAQDTHVYRGTKGWHCYRTGPSYYPDQGWNEWGIKKDLSTLVKKGGTLHFQCSVFFPAAFNFEADPWLKFMRVLHHGSGGVHAGHHDMYIRNNLITGDIDGQLHVTSEALTGNYTLPGQIMQKGVWETFEIQVVADNIAKTAGGVGAIRVWRKVNGVMVLIHEKLTNGTIVAADGSLSGIYVFGGTWNNSDGGDAFPKTTQTAYLDSIIVETRMNQLTKTDSAGNKIIGL
jgi:hypothetical protein